jgi:hypothetical protein
MDWKECNHKRFVKKIQADSPLIDSLIKSSKNKIESCKRLELDEVTASTKVSLAYEGLRESLEAVAIKKGFKIYNHECYCSFLKEVCEKSTLSANFDRFRRIRNQINYYGKDISIADAKELIKEIIILESKIRREFL